MMELLMESLQLDWPWRLACLDWDCCGFLNEGEYGVDYASGPSSGGCICR